MLRFKNKKEEHKICMYVEKDALKMSDEVQKDIDLEDILLNHTKFYDDIKVADKDGYIPLSWASEPINEVNLKYIKQWRRQK